MENQEDTDWAGESTVLKQERPATPPKKLSIAAYYGDNCGSASQSSHFSYNNYLEQQAKAHAQEQQRPLNGENSQTAWTESNFRTKMRQSEGSYVQRI